MSHQITMSNINEICPLAIQNQIFLISMHVPSLVKTPRHLHKLSSGNKNMSVFRADNSNKICPLVIPNQISILSMHIPSLVKIHWCLLKLSSGNKIRVDKRTDDWLTDWQTQGRPKWNHNVIMWRGIKKALSGIVWTASSLNVSLDGVYWLLINDIIFYDYWFLA